MSPSNDNDWPVAERKPIKPKSSRLWVVIGGLGAVVLLLMLVLVYIPKGAQNAEPSTAPDSAEPAAVSSEPSETDEPEQVTEFVGAIVEQTRTIEEMDSITDLNEFAKLPYADRLAFALAKRPNMAISYPGNDFGFDDPTSIPGYFWQSVEGTSFNGVDTFEGAKIISAKDYYTTDLLTGEIDTEYQAVANSVIQTGGEGKGSNRVIIFEDTGEWQSGLDREGNEIDFINITAHSGDNATGERTAADLTYQTIRQEVLLLSGESVIFYPIGYSINGKNPPDDGYDY